MNMKKKFYLLLLAIQLLTAFGYAAQADDVVRRIRLHKNTIHTRSLTDAPEASIQRDILTVSFDGSGMYSLYIEDSFGVIVYSSASFSPVPPASTKATLHSTTDQYEQMFSFHSDFYFVYFNLSCDIYIHENG